MTIDENGRCTACEQRGRVIEVGNMSEAIAICASCLIRAEEALSPVPSKGAGLRVDVRVVEYPVERHKSQVWRFHRFLHDREFYNGRRAALSVLPRILERAGLDIGMSVAEDMSGGGECAE